jgi:hypothetical protein
MDPLKPSVVLAALTFVSTYGLILCAPHEVGAQGHPVQIVGDYRYASHPGESLAEARNIAYAEAIRLAISSAPLFKENTSTLVDSKLHSDLVQKIASGYLREIAILEQSENGRTVYCKVRASVMQDEIETLIDRELNRGSGREPTGLDWNRALQILRVQEDQEGNIQVVYKALKRLDWLHTAYDGSLQDSANVMIDFYDSTGALTGSDRYPARKTSSGEDIMAVGRTGVVTFKKPANARSYRVWLVK